MGGTHGLAKGDLALFNSASPLVPGGIFHVPVENQTCRSICWSFTLNEHADAESKKVTGTLNLTTPDHNGYWHLYFEIFNHKQYFNKLAAKVASGKISEADAITEAERMLRSRPGSRDAQQAGYTLDPGSDESIALTEAKIVGFVPASLFSLPLNTPAQAQNFQKGLNSLLKSILANPRQLQQYSTTDADGINTPLYNLLNQNLQPYLSAGGSTHPPYRPNDTFTVNGATYTPVTYMTQQMKFDPDAWSMVNLTAQNAPLIRQAIHDSLTGSNPTGVPVGFGLYNQAAFEQGGVLSTDLFATTAPVLAGGHETLIVNGKVDANAQVQGDIFQNSWGAQGLDIDGAQPASPDQSGFNGMTLDYIDFTVQQGEPPQYLFSKTLLSQPGYQSLMADATLKRERTPRKSPKP
jgi:hypothetical protein